MIDIALVEECAPLVHPATMQTLVQTESSGNPYAIGVVGLDLVNQPQSKAEAIDSANSLIEQGYNVSLGLGQINMHNFEGLELTVETAFDPCENLRASSEVLNNCFDRALANYEKQQDALQAAFSCYYSNNFSRGFAPDDANGNSYVGRIAANSEEYKIPGIEFTQETLLSGSGEVQSSNQQYEKEEIKALEEITPDLEKGNVWDVFSDFSD